MPDQAREYVRERVEAAIEGARRVVDAAEMAALPRAELTPVQVDCGTVHYTRERRVRLLLTNTGQVGRSLRASSCQCRD